MGSRRGQGEVSQARRRRVVIDRRSDFRHEKSTRLATANSRIQDMSKGRFMRNPNYLNYSKDNASNTVYKELNNSHDASHSSLL